MTEKMKNDTMSNEKLKSTDNGGPVTDELLRHVSARILIRSTLDIISPKMDKKYVNDYGYKFFSAQEWFDNDEIYPLSITAVCAVLELDKHLVRKKVKEWKNDPNISKNGNVLGMIKRECVISAIKSGKNYIETLASNFMVTERTVRKIATKAKLEVKRLPKEMCLRGIDVDYD